MSSGRVDPQALDQQLRSTLLAAPASAFPALLVLLVLAHALEARHLGWLWAWGLAFALVTGLRLTAVGWWRRLPLTAQRAAAWQGPWLASTAVHAAQWGALGCFAVLLPQSPESMAVEAVLHITLAAVAMGGAMRLQGFERMLVVHALLVLGPLTLRDLLQGDLVHAVLGALLLLYGLYAVVQGQRQSRLVAEMSRQRAQAQQLMEALQRAYQSSEEARQRLESVTTARSRFFAAANHDLRQPLHALGLLSESLQHARALPEVRQVASHMSECVEGMAQVVDELLEVTRLDLGQVQVNTGAVRLAAVVEDACRPYQALARLKGLALELELPAVEVRTDPALLARVIANLVSNGIRYTAQGVVRVGAEVEEDAVRLFVRDTGQGIAEEHLPRLFEPFFQVANAARDRRQGLGLGLSTVQRLCELLNITIEVESTPGVGTCFRLRLPGAPSPAADAEVLPPSRPATPSLLGLRVLVVDDDRDVQRSVAQVLQTWGCDVQQAGDAESARRCLAQGFVPQAVIVDLRLPGAQDGWTLLQAMCAAANAPPGLLVTGDAGAAGVEAARSAGWPVLVKPVRPAALRAFLGQAVAAAAAPEPRATP